MAQCRNGRRRLASAAVAEDSRGRMSGARMIPGWLKHHDIIAPYEYRNIITVALGAVTYVSITMNSVGGPKRFNTRQFNGTRFAASKVLHPVICEGLREINSFV